ncbi:MAG: hypothetical protein C7B47_03665 [Sulfobacillus thermosulfidooxidans]|uniref:Uncharacterized protein n=1 Tax=Sulfobacillus thermosulfidooxidans TaxID=28034 RepID=A0A2T2X3N4_SULTH|nr:MAG: hypothetical protein C7B47_03665 [Sulfobacillus thermosulfidooxidans]
MMTFEELEKYPAIKLHYGYKVVKVTDNPTEYLPVSPSSGSTVRYRLNSWNLQAEDMGPFLVQGDFDTAKRIARTIPEVTILFVAYVPAASSTAATGLWTTHNGEKIEAPVPSGGLLARAVLPLINVLDSFERP